jgi:hypothetical protein
MVSAGFRRTELSIEGVDREGQVVVSGELLVTSLDNANDCRAVAAARLDVVGQGEASFSPWFATGLWSLVGHIADVFPPSVGEVYVTPKRSRVLSRSGGRLVWV